MMPPYQAQCILRYSPNLVEGEFCELPLYGVLRSSGLPCYSETCFVPWSTYTRITQEYAAFVTWPSRRRVKVQDRYLSTFQMRASYPTNYLPLGRSASPQLLRWC
jgi:hypothetical protein